MWEYQNTDELYHHGVIGMRWGHRKQKPSSKFFNRIRRNRVIKGIRNASEKRKLNTTVTNDNKTGITNRVNNAIRNRVNYKQATNDQLKRATERIRLENAYQQAVQERLRLNPAKKSLVSRAVSKVFSEAIAPAAMNAGRSYLENLIKNRLEGEKPLTNRDIYKQKVDDLVLKSKEYEAKAKIKRNKDFLDNSSKKSSKKTLKLNTSSDTVYKDTTNQAIANILKKKKK